MQVCDDEGGCDTIEFEAVATGGSGRPVTVSGKYDSSAGAFTGKRSPVVGTGHVQANPAVLPNDANVTPKTQLSVMADKALADVGFRDTSHTWIAISAPTRGGRASAASTARRPTTPPA